MELCGHLACELAMKLTRIFPLLALALAPLPASATGFVVTENPEDAADIHVSKLDVQARIDGGVATVSVRQVFRNTTDRDLEGHVLFPVPEGSAFGAFSMSVGEEQVEGLLLDRESAVSHYEEVVRKLRDPGVLEFVGRGLVRCRLYPLPARGTKTIRLEYRTPLRRRGGCDVLSLPLRSASLHGVVGLLSVRVEARGEGLSLASSGYPLVVGRPGPGQIVGEMFRPGFRPARDLEVRVLRPGDGAAPALLTWREPGAEDGVFCVELTPGPLGSADALRTEPRDVTYLVDVSGSMSGDLIRAARAALRGSVRLLAPDDRLRLVTFSGEAQDLTRGFQAATPAAVRAFEGTVKGLRAGGGTNMEAGLRTALARSDGSDRLHYVVLISDGFPGPGLESEPELVDMVKELREGRTRLFSVGVGDGVNLFLLEQLARSGGGLSTFVADDAQVAERIERFMARLDRPVLDDVTLTCSGAQVFELAPESGLCPPLFAGDALRLFGRFKTAGPSRLKIEVQGTRQGAPRMPLSIPTGVSRLTAETSAWSCSPRIRPTHRRQVS